MSNQMKHTKGPWRVCTDERTVMTGIMKCDIAAVFHCDSDVHSIAYVPTPVLPTDVHAELFANARLIAAAPELLDALYLALPYVETAENDPAYKQDGIRALLKQIRTVITKVESKVTP